MTRNNDQLGRRRLLGWGAGGLATAGTFLLASSISGSQAVVGADGGSEQAAGIGEDPADIDYSAAPVALLPSDFAATRAYLTTAGHSPAPPISTPGVEPLVNAGAPQATAAESSTGASTPRPSDVRAAMRPRVTPHAIDVSEAAATPTAPPPARIDARTPSAAAATTPTPADVRTPRAAVPTPTPDPTPRNLDPYDWLPATDRIVIPRIGVDAPVVTVGVAQDGVVDTPAFAAGRYVRSSEGGGLGNVVLSAHNDIDGALFRALPTTPHDALIYIHRGAAVFTYEVRYQTRVWEEGAPERLRRSNARFLLPTANPVCTLITCVPLWVDTHRWIVRGLLVDSQLPPRGRDSVAGRGGR